MASESKSVDARQRTLARELEWVRMGAKARQAKGKARLSAYEKLLAEANDAKDQTRELEIAIPPGPRLGDTGHRGQGPAQGLRRPAAHRGPDVLAAAGGDRRDHRARTAPARRRCSGCSSARRRPTPARSTIGDTVQLSYVDQSRDDLAADKTVFQEITQGAEIIKVGQPRAAGAGLRLAASTSAAPTSRSSSGQLSGGERNRVHLAKLLQSGGNVLLLDEPTNDLDVDTLRALEAGLESFPGCVVVISHDRWFLDRIATHILAFEGDSQVRWFEGNVSDYEAFRHKELGTAADQPHRIRYKRLAS